MSYPIRQSRTRSSIAGAILLAAAIALSACSTADPLVTATVDTDAEVAPLSIVTPNSDPSAVANLFLAQGLGYFEDENVTIDLILGAGATGAALLASGDADLLLAPTSVGLPLIKQGQPISVIFSDVGGGLGAAVAVPSNSPASRIEDLEGKKVGANGTTGLGYGFANLLSNQIEDGGGEGFELVAFNDAATMLNALTSGGIDAASATTGNFAPLVASGQLRLIVDTTDETIRTELLGASYTIDTSYIGVPDVLDSQRESVVRFLSALTRANVYLQSHTPAEIARILRQDTSFASLTEESITQSVAARFPFYTPTNGMVTEDAWDGSLDWFTKWDIPTVGAIDADPDFAYDKVVDMSYLSEAQDRLGADGVAPSADSGN